MRALNAAASGLLLFLLSFLMVVLMTGDGVAQTGKKAATAAPEWLGWGGPRHNFTSDSKGLANTWPADGPKRLWSRPLGEGHSSIIGEAGRLYTMYRPSTGVRNTWKEEEVVIALDAASGKTIWEYR